MQPTLSHARPRTRAPNRLPRDAGSLGDAPVDARPKDLRILFIGNSYTYVNDLPGMLSRIAATSGVLPTITTDQIVQGGARLIDHWNNGVAQGRIRDGGFTHVVLQGQSEEAALPYDSDVFALSARHFGDLAVGAGAQPTLFVTWARAPGDGDYDAGNPNGAFVGPEQMQDSLTWTYANVARRWPASILACVGEAFRQSLKRDPGTVRLLYGDARAGERVRPHRQLRADRAVPFVHERDRSRLRGRARPAPAARDPSADGELGRRRRAVILDRDGATLRAWATWMRT